jgi:hypothetical protein
VIEVIVEIIGDVEEIGHDVVFVQEILFLHFVYPISWVRTIEVKIYDSLHVPALNADVFDPLVDRGIIMAFWSARLGL